MFTYFNRYIGKNQVYLIKKLFLFLAILSVLFCYGCGWVLVGAGAYGGYKAATDPRSLGTQIDDATITAKIKLKLIEDPELKAFSIDVDTVNGIVTLTGVVNSEKQRIKAIEIAKSVPGVKKIIDNLQVK